MLFVTTTERKLDRHPGPLVDSGGLANTLILLTCVFDAWKDLTCGPDIHNKTIFGNNYVVEPMKVAVKEMNSERFPTYNAT